MKDGPFAYGSSYKTGGEQPRFFRTPRDGGAEEIILDGDLEAEGKPYFRIGGSDHSADHGRLHLGLRRQGLGILHACASAMSPPARSRRPACPTPAAAASGTPARRLLLHAPRRQPPAVEALLPHARHRRFAATAWSTRRAIPASSWMSAERAPTTGSSSRSTITRPRNTGCSDAPTRPPTPQLVAARETGLQYDLEEGGDVFFILTNADGAKDFKIVTAPVSRPDAAELDGSRAA